MPELRDLKDSGHIVLSSLIFDFVFLLGMISLGIYIFVRSLFEWPLLGILVAGFLLLVVAVSVIQEFKEAYKEFEKWRTQK